MKNNKTVRVYLVGWFNFFQYPIWLKLDDYEKGMFVTALLEKYNNYPEYIKKAIVKDKQAVKGVILDCSKHLFGGKAFIVSEDFKTYLNENWNYEK